MPGPVPIKRQPNATLHSYKHAQLYKDSIKFSPGKCTAYDEVELMEPLLFSDDREAMRLSPPDDRLLDEAVAISNCCLVC